jgi:putative tricarboxylic transport membrane protein
MPFLLGSLLLITSIWLILRSAFGMGGKAEIIEKEEEKGQIKLRRIIFILGSLFLYALFLETLGYLMTTSIFFIFLYRITGVKRWGPLLLATALTVSISYFGFTALGIIFPDGIIGRILTGR